MLPTLLIGFNAEPILTLAERLRHLDPNHSFDGIAERYRSRAGSDLQHIQSVAATIRLSRSGTGNDSAFSRLQSTDPENALFSYLRAAQAAGNASTNDASTTFEIVGPMIESALQAERCDWYVSEAMEAWQWAYQTIDVGPTMRVRWARDAATREQANAIGDASAALLQLADDLLRAGQDEAGRTCVRGALDFSRRTLDDARGADVALACAGSIERARRLESAILARAGEWDEKQRADERAESAAQFAQVLRSRMNSATQDPILQIPILRGQPFRTTSAYLLSCGFLFAGWIALLGVGVATTLLSVIARVTGGPATGEIPRVGPGPFHWFWCAALVIGPATLLGTAVQWIQPDLAIVTSQTWIQSGVLVVFILTLASVLTLARSRASAGEPPPKSHRVWLLWWVLVAVFAILVFFRPWSPLGRNLDAFDLGLRMPLAPARVSLFYAAVAACSLLGLVVWLVWVLLAAWRGRRRDGGSGGRSGTGRAFLRSAAVLAVWGWLILGILCAGSIRLYHRHDTRLQQLVAKDLQDEVSAWMGPAWARSFFD